MFIPAAADEAQEDDHCTKTAAALQLMDEMEREMEAYCTTMPDEKAVVQEYMEEDEAMRARFEEWMKEYDRTYKDEVEKARRFKIFKAFARCVDVANAESAQAGSSARFGLTEFADWNAEEMSRAEMSGLLRAALHLLVMKKCLSCLVLHLLVMRSTSKWPSVIWLHRGPGIRCTSKAPYRRPEKQ